MANPELYIFHNIVREHTGNILDEFDKVLNCANAKCMDIGCGPGDITKEILLPALHPTATIIGTDISEDMINCANNLYADNRLRFEVLDIQTKNLPEKYISQFNYIFSFHALHWCSDIRQAYENMYRMLRPGGVMIILTIHDHDIFHVLNELAFDKRFEKYTQHENKFLPPFYDSSKPQRDMSNLLQDIGFVVHHSSRRERTNRINKIESYTSMIMSFIPVYLRDMPDNLMKEFSEDVKLKFARKKNVDYSMPLLFDKSSIIDVHEILVINAQKCNAATNLNVPNE